MNTIAIVGGGIGGIKAAETLRALGYDGTLAVFEKSRHWPYDRPPLSKAFLAGQVDQDSLYLHDPQWYQDHDIRLELGWEVTAIDPGARRLRGLKGQEVAYDHLILASGAVARRLTVPQADLSGVFYLRTLSDADALRAWIQAGQRAVVVGAGFVGMEVAIALRQRGLDVTVVEPQAVPLQHIVGPQVGAVTQALLERAGIRFVPQATVAGLHGPGQVEQVTLSDGRHLPADVVVIGIGVQPIAPRLPVQTADSRPGVLVNEYGQTAWPQVWACGDVSVWPSRRFGRRLHVEHWDHAQNHAATVAGNLLGAQRAYDQVPYFWSDLGSTTLQYVGYAPQWDQLVIRGALSTDSGLVFYLTEGRIAAALAINRPREIVLCRRLVGRADPVAVHQLEDPGYDLKRLMPSPSAVSQPH